MVDNVAVLLKTREQELSAIYQNVPGILFYIAVEPDGEFRFLSISDAFLVATGLTREHVVGSLVRDVIPSPSSEIALDHYRQAIRMHQTVRWEAVSESPAGRRSGEIAVTPLYDANGLATHLIGIAHEITERKRLEQLHREEEERQTFRLKVSDALRRLSAPVAIQETAARLLREHLQVNSVSSADIQGMETFGAQLLEEYRRGNPVVVNDVRTDPRLAESERAKLLSSAIAAFAGVVLIKSERCVAGFRAHDAKPRLWTTGEVELIRDVAERTWEAMELTRAEEALREREQRLRLALDASRAGSWMRDVRTGRVDWDDRFRELYGFTAGEPGSFEAWLGRVYEEDRPLQLELWNRIVHMKTHDTFDSTFRIVRPDGTVLWIQSLGSVHRDVEGQIVRLAGLDLDVTERQHAEEALRLSEHKLRLSLRAGRMGTWQYDLDTHSFVAGAGDEVGRKMHGFEPPEMIETLEQAQRYVHPDDRSRIQRDFEESIADGASHHHEYRVVLPSGDTRWIAAVWMRQPGTRFIFGVVQDITERKQAELDLQDRNREQERTLRLLLETAEQGILAVDARGFIVMANATAESMFGWASGELIGQSVEQLLPAAFRARHVTHRTAYFKTPQARRMGGGLELVAERKDGSTFPVEISLNHVATPEGRRAIAFVADITARKRAEEALQRSHAELERRTLQLSRLASQLTLAEQNAREQLARTLHDGIQQLLFSAGIRLDHAVKGSTHPGQARLLQSARADINEAIEAARTLSVNLFPPMLHIGGLPAALAWLATRTREQYGVVVNMTADPRANPAASDTRILLFEAVRELLFNAVKHAHVDQIDVNLWLGPGDTLHIHVSDEGVGFDQTATLHHMNYNQVGLGLFGIQERLALLGGRLDIQSAPGKGARFSLIIPRGDLALQATGGEDACGHDKIYNERLVYDSASGPSKRLRILIADDHVVTRAGLRELFNEHPVLQVVGEATNGVESVSQAMTLQPDVIVIDVSMPQMNGIEATRLIRDALPYSHIVGLSTHDDENSERSMREAGAEAYFTKGEQADRLLDYLLSLRAQTKGTARS